MISDFVRKHTTESPVLLHELRARMRGRRAGWILLAYMTIVAGAIALTALFSTASSQEGGSDSPQGPMLFAILIGVQAALIALIAPALTSGAITLEREHQTYEMLASSRMNAAGLVWGKLAASLAFLMFCLIASMPVVFVAAAFGGLTLGQVVSSYVLLALEASVFGAVGLFWSSTLRSTIAATVMALPTVLIACIAFWPCGMAAIMVSQHDMNSFGAVGFGILGSLSPFVAGMVGSEGIPFFDLRIPFWLPGVLLGPLVVALLLSFAAQQLELISPPRRSWTLPLATVLAVLVTVLLTGGLLSPGEKVPYSPSNLWASLFCILAAATPLLVAPSDYEGLSLRKFFARSGKGVGVALSWYCMCSAIVVTGLLCTAPLVDHKASLAAFHLIPGSLLFIASVLALETTLTLAVIRATGNRLWGMGTALGMGVLMALYPVIVSINAHNIDDVWASIYLAPISVAFHPTRHPWMVSPVALYFSGAALLLLLTMLPLRKKK